MVPAYEVPHQEPRSSQFLVPVEYANAKLWSVTSEYENLLNMQREHHQLVLRQKDVELAHIQNATAKLGQADSMQSRMQADTIAAELDAKNKELELFAGLLQMRDRQIGDLQQMCETKQEQLNQLRESEPRSPRGQAPGCCGEATKRWQQLPVLEPCMAEDKHGLQFGQAPADSLTSTKDGWSEQQVRDLQNESQRLRMALSSAEGALSATLSQVRKLPNAQKSDQCHWHEPRILQLQEALEQSNAQLARTESALQQLLRSNGNKDQLLRELTQKLTLNEAKLQTYQLCDFTAHRTQTQGPLPERNRTDRGTDAPADGAEASASYTVRRDRRHPEVQATGPGSGGSSPSACSVQAPEPSALLPRSAVDETCEIASDVKVVSIRRPAPGLLHCDPVDASPVPDADAAFWQDTLSEAYHADPLDPVDLQIAKFVDCPQYSFCKAMFCRLEEGTYLFGAQRIQIRMGVGNHLEVLHGGCWIRLELYLRNSEAYM
jgi:hypothetical protein